MIRLETVIGSILSSSIKREKNEQKERTVTVAHHKVPATTEHFSRDTTVRTEGVFRIQNVTEEKKKH